MDDLPKPRELKRQLDANRIELGAVVKLMLEHLAVIYEIKSIDLVLLNGLLQDMAAVTAELKLARPSERLTNQMKEMARQSLSQENDPPPPSAVDPDVAVASSDQDEG